MDLENLLEMSHRYGADEEYVIAGGGNTSYKENGVLYVKSSGAQMADITVEQFVAMDMEKLLRALERPPQGETDAEREEAALFDLMAARQPGEEAKRPSVESILHAMFPYKYVLHLHPAVVNGLMCSRDGENTCKRLFPEKALWIGLTKPGLVLAQVCKKTFDEFKSSYGKHPQIVLLENHGIFVAADDVAEIDDIIEYVTSKIKELTSEKPDFSEVLFDRKAACRTAPALRMLFSDDGVAAVVFCTNRQVMKFVADKESFAPLIKPLSPDHIVYCKDEPLFLEPDDDVGACFFDFSRRKGYKPKIVAVSGLGFFALGKTKKEAEQARLLFLDAMKINVYAGSFGGVDQLPDEFTKFILNWEAEQYRSKVSKPETSFGRLSGKIVLITGGARGFGKGLAEFMANEGAYISVSDLNGDGACACASGINSVYGPDRAISVAADVSDEESVEFMVQETVLSFGGLDVLISNAGVLMAGGLSEMTKQNFEFVTKVNYTGYFLCTKYAVDPMKIQRSYAKDFLMDVIEINSKSGLTGSNKNFAYSGSKFGGIGLTQSFAMELVEYGIKVNAVCPGNLLDGPLWSDPEQGLFKQYLDSGKVPGAKTIDDVRKFYEQKVPLKRGCTIEDVCKAVIYVIEQKYETGQAIPVTGGQVLLK